MTTDGAIAVGPNGGILRNLNRPEIPRATLDVTKEGFLYAIGKELVIFAHRPPQPFGSDQYISPFDKDEDHATQEVLNSRSPDDHVFTVSPRDRADDSRAPESADAYLDIEGDVAASLVVTHVLKAGDCRGAQVVLCDVNKSESLTMYWNKMGHANHPKQIVAKLYDPLLYPKDHPVGTWIRIDTVNAADREYAAEAASYMEFHQHMDDPMVRDFVPRFYGTWTTSVENEGWGSSTTRPIPGTNNIQTVRPVRMVLMEYIDGSRLHRVTRRRYEEDRGTFLDTSNLVIDGHDASLDLFSRIVRGLVALKFRGILAGGVSARNFLIDDSENGYQNPPEFQPLGDDRMVMIGHGGNTVARYTVQRRHVIQLLDRPPHPVCEEFGPIRMHSLAGLFPPEWVRDIKPYIDWAHQTFRAEDYTSKEDAEKQTAEKEEAEKKEAEKKSQDSGPEYMSTSSDTDPVPGLTTSVDTLDTLATSIDSLRALQMGQSSTPMDTGRQGEPTAKEAGRKAEEAGITPVMEQGGEGEDAHHDADDEKSPEDSPDQSPGQSPEGKAGGTGETSDKSKK